MGKTNIEHYYSKNPKCKKIEYLITKNIFGNQVSFKTASGMYSPKHLDAGSLVQLKHLQIKNKDKVLDLGCAYGTVGILIKKMYPKTVVFMSDINQRAIDYAKQNIKLNNVDAKVLQSDAFENIKDKDFDVIVFNPPINAGLKICYKLIAGSFNHLKLNSTLQVVLRSRGGGASILKKMKAIFGNVKKIANEGIYEIYISKKETSEPVSDYDKSMLEKNRIKTNKKE